MKFIMIKYAILQYITIICKIINNLFILYFLEKKKKNNMDKQENKMLNLFGFELKAFKSFSSLIDLMNRPEDPASLAIFRICFGN